MSLLVNLKKHVICKQSMQNDFISFRLLCTCGLQDLLCWQQSVMKIFESTCLLPRSNTAFSQQDVNEHAADGTDLWLLTCLVCLCFVKVISSNKCYLNL